jgi:hypothetical protein
LGELEGGALSGDGTAEVCVAARASKNMFSVARSARTSSFAAAACSRHKSRSRRSPSDMTAIVSYALRHFSAAFSADSAA